VTPYIDLALKVLRSTVNRYVNDMCMVLTPIYGVKSLFPCHPGHTTPITFVPPPLQIWHARIGYTRCGTMGHPPHAGVKLPPPTRSATGKWGCSPCLLEPIRTCDAKAGAHRPSRIPLPSSGLKWRQRGVGRAHRHQAGYMAMMVKEHTSGSLLASSIREGGKAVCGCYCVTHIGVERK
jgi:hypothetical protein